MPSPKTTVVVASRERIREAAKTLFAQRGYEGTSTAAICRIAGTSQSQLVKHFTSKQGVLEAIFEYAWEKINPAVHLATESISSPREKLRILIDMVLGFLDGDRALRTVFLFEGRRIRGDGHLVILVPGFFEFVKTVDGILNELATSGELLPSMHPQAIRSALMGTVEGLLRDRQLASTSHFPASFSAADARSIITVILSAFLTK